jgi:hypothetical protein
MNSEKTQIRRKNVSAPTRWIVEHVNLNYRFVLHHGEGKAFQDTEAMCDAGGIVYSYDPNTEANDINILLGQYDIGISNYVFNTLAPYWRELAFSDLMKACQRALIAVRTDRVPGEPVADGVFTQRGTFQTQLTKDEWVQWFTDASPEGTNVSLLHNGGHFCIIEVSR